MGVIYDPIYLKHDTGHHVEKAARLERTLEILEGEGVWERLEKVAPRAATYDELALVHDPEYIALIEARARGGGGWLDADTVMSRDSFHAALYAAGGVIRGAEAVLEGAVDVAFALVRPPGHHAVARRAMGFCLFNNVAIAARYVMQRFSLERVLIVDFDVHHGNGTQDAFYSDPRVLYFSVHQSPLYPGTGRLEEVGEGEGTGTTINLPLPPGCGDEQYIRAFREVLLPAARRFAPQLIMVSAGFDAHFLDPIAMMNLTVMGFAGLVRLIKEMAEEFCSGKTVYTLEGGYHLDALAHSILACFKELLGEPLRADPLGSPQLRSSPDITPIIEAARAEHRL